MKKGEKYNRLTAIRFDHKDKYYNHYWFFKCDCGNKKVIEVGNIKSEKIKSCGCLQIENGKNRKTHGMRHTKEYNTWVNMKGRCLNKNNPAYSRYGGRGIKICKQWMKFENFYADMGERPKNKSIDRTDNNEGYFKENCRWATAKQQGNNKRNNITEIKKLEKELVKARLKCLPKNIRVNIG